MPEMNFYVGYQPAAAPSIRRFIRRTLIVLGGASLAVAIVLIRAQGPFAASHFEYGVYRDYEGELVEWPYPALIANETHYLLVGLGKFGVTEEMRGHDGANVRLRGALISRGPDQMLEIDPQSVRFVSKEASSERHIPQRHMLDLGTVTLTGEIVDTKCHLGVMNPGEGKVHRDCAVRCISGGAPPGFLVRDNTGETRLLLLVGGDGRALGREVLDYVAEPIRISGRLKRSGSSLILLAEPRDFRRE
jgi:hypothetical protein